MTFFYRLWRGGQLSLRRQFLRHIISSLSLYALSCSSSGLVGGECAAGYTNCDGWCVDLSSEVDHCGACDSPCVGEQVCQSGACSDEMEGVQETPRRGGSGGQVETLPRGSGGSFEPVQEMPGSGGFLPVTGTGGVAGWGGALGGMGGQIGPGGSGGSLVCNSSPLVTECAGSCVDVSSDPLHCGFCGNYCPSGLCASVACLGATSGHMVAICDSLGNVGPSGRRLFSNSVFLSGENLVRILAYGEYSSPSVIDAARGALADGAILKGRAYALTESYDAAEVLDLQRQDYDAFVVYDQPLAPPGNLATLATNWSSTVEDFVEEGGVVVVTTGGGGQGEMQDLISGLNILSTSGTTDHTGQSYYLQSPGDALALGVFSPYLATETSCTFNTSDSPSGLNVFVTSDIHPNIAVGNPGAIHRIILP
ncbi:MAG: hypothetical protein MK135_12905 [Polyangiaceae bacterium]|nr:hypothetical protein [Polyangiaceae bacterium]